MSTSEPGSVRAHAPDARQQAVAAAWPSVNALTAPLVANLLRDAKSLRIGIERLANGTVIVDAGIAQRGGFEAGRRIAEICMGGLGQVSIQAGGPFARWPWQLSVYSADPVLACLGSQYAGWSLSHGEGKGAFFALGSGPGRAAACREDLFVELAYRDEAESVCLVLEVDKAPPVELAEKIARHCGVAPDKVTLILTPTRSLAGAVQIVARVLEVALHKAHTVGFPLHHIVDGIGSAPLAPPAGDFLIAMGRTNDAILFGGQVQLLVDCEDAEAERLAHNLPSGASMDYGKPFARIFKDVEYDFYRIDPNLFAPAVAAVTVMKSGRTFRAGALDEKLLAQSFEGES
ncbi:MAG TPA: methenyltetrahydromethanopterin cyclohydrolase [Burkholderiales bacterium]|nr:methenyltetrahydromethanopterin cyclohydrolase [Burkholderiales bacterium]